MYWNINKILPYQRNFNFINGERSIGKTYTTLKFILKKFLDNGHEFVYLVRTQNEIKQDIFSKALDKVITKEYKDCNFSFKKNQMFFEENEVKIPVGYCIALTEAQKIKKMSFPNVKWLIFDEYMLENKNTSAYVNGWNEPDLFLSIYHTIDREEDRVVCFCLGNNTEFYNPYHMHDAFNIPKIKKGGIWYSENVLFQWAVSDGELEEKKKSSKFLKMISKTTYGNYAKNGNYYLDNNSFIAEREKSDCIFNLKYNNKIYGIWYSKNNLVFIDTKNDPSRTTITINLLEHTEDNILLNKNNPYMVYISNHLKRGTLRFTSMEIKKSLEELLGKIM